MREYSTSAVATHLRDARGSASSPVAAASYRFVEQFGCSGALQDAALRKRHELDIDDVPVGLAHAEDLFQRPEPDGAVHRDMAAHLR